MSGRSKIKELHGVCPIGTFMYKCKQNYVKHVEVQCLRSAGQSVPGPFIYCDYADIQLLPPPV